MQTRGRVVHAFFDSCRRMNDFTGPLPLRLDRTLLFFCSAAGALGGGGEDSYNGLLLIFPAESSNCTRLQSQLLFLPRWLPHGRPLRCRHLPPTVNFPSQSSAGGTKANR